MRKIVAGLFISLDGVVESPIRWRLPYLSGEVSDMMSAGIAHSDAMLLGRRTYQQFAEFWPTQASDVPMAGYMNNTPKYVVSATLDKVEWQNSTLIKGNVVEELARLKQQPGKNIQIPGSPTLVRSLLRDGLIDELALMIHPIVVGSGRRLFDETAIPMGLKLVESRTFSNGVLSVTYQPARA